MVKKTTPDAVEPKIDLVDPKLDLVFKAVFSDKELLIAFLNAVLNLLKDKKITDMIYQDRVISGNFPKDKGPILDLLVLDQSQENYHIEIQFQNQEHPT